MKKITVPVFLALMLILTACQNEKINIPPREKGASNLFVSHLKEPSISMLDMDKGSSKKISIPFTLTSIAEVNSHYIIASSKNEKDIYAIDFNKEVIFPLFSVGEGLVDMIYHHEKEMLYACNMQNNSVQVIDIENESIVKEISVGAYPVQAEIYDSHLYVLASGSSEVYVIDLDTDEVVSSFDVNPRPAGLLFDGTHLWVGGHGATGELNNRIYAYNPRSGENMTSIETGLMPVFFYQEEQRSLLYVLNHGDHSLASINPDTWQLEEKLFVGDNPSFMVGDESSLYIASLDGDEVIQVNKKEMNITKAIPLTNGPFLLHKGGNRDE